MFTQCPKCQSVFMVSEKDVKAHEGLVRCGNCYSVFNSSWNLTDDPRHDFVEPPKVSNAGGVKGTMGSGFTFSILDQSLASAGTDSAQVEEGNSPEEVLPPGVQEKSSAETAEAPAEGGGEFDGESQAAPELEPFPEPDRDDFQSPLSKPDINENADSLLYFDANNEGDEAEAYEPEDIATPIEDLTILQTPSFIDELPSLDDIPLQDDISRLDETVPPDQSEDAANEDVEEDAEESADDEIEVSAPGSLTAESMWPGSEAQFENDDGPEQDEEEQEAVEEVEAVEVVEETSAAIEVAEELIEEELIEEEVVEGIAEAGIEEAIEEEVAEEIADAGTEELIEEELLPSSADDKEPDLVPIMAEPAAEDAPEIIDEIEVTAPNGTFLNTGTDETYLTDISAEVQDTGSMPTLDSYEEVVAPESLDETDEMQLAENVITEMNEEVNADEFFSIETAQDAEDDTVFITSDEEKVDEAYIPISLKSDNGGELFHGLEEFPEPGELSALNLEDTMEINAMLEEANISKEQIESALSAAEIEGEEKDKGNIEEIFLTSDADIDLTDAIFSSGRDDSEGQSGEPGNQKENAAPAGSFFRRLLPFGVGKKTVWKEPALADDQTQLIQSLNRGRDKAALPQWVSKYSLVALTGVLIIVLLGQIGFFYMDKLVHITPLRPLLVAGCGIAGCTVPQPLNLSEIEQLSSRLQPLGGSEGGFKVSSILINRGIRSQTFPALELTLTDRSGNMISRRVVTPDKYLSSEHSSVIKPNEAVDINIRFRTPSIRVEGFELRPVSQNWLERSK